MNKRVLLACVALVCCAPTMARREQQLADYRAALDRIHTAKPDDPDDVKPFGDPRLLVRLSREVVRRVLGPPIECKVEGDKTAPCRSPDDWFYSFYAPLPEDEVGGGLELLLRFNAAGKEARWAYSE